MSTCKAWTIIEKLIAPDPQSGSVCFVTSDSVLLANVSITTGFDCLRRLGIGSGQLIGNLSAKSDCNIRLWCWFFAIPLSRRGRKNRLCIVLEERSQFVPEVAPQHKQACEQDNISSNCKADLVPHIAFKPD